MGEHFLNGKVVLHAGDCLDVLARLDANSIDSVVCDPPYHLTSIVKRFGAENAAPAKPMKSGGKEFQRLSTGFMGKQWDGGDIAFRPETWAAVYRVLKPGGYLLAFSGTRTYHRMACAIEDAGFEVRDMVSWVFGSGFPKSQNVAKFIDRELGAKGTLGAPRSAAHAVMLEAGVARRGEKHEGWDRPWMDDPEAITAAQSTYIPATPEAEEFNGFGTALKPALEPICMARKPLSEKTVAANVLEWGTGAINIDGCRVGFSGEDDAAESKGKNRHADFETGPRQNSVYGKDERNRGNYNPPGRWPANLLHDGSEEVVGAFPESGPASDKPRNNGAFDSVAKGHDYPHTTFGHADNGGSAARYFYSAKADSNDRIGSKHPTVKPVDLMQYLVRLVTPKGGTVLDPFSGTGTTGEAAWREGMRAVLIEADANYQVDIRRRMALCMAGPDERVRESIKARGEPVDYGPLFAARVVAE